MRNVARKPSDPDKAQQQWIWDKLAALKMSEAVLIDGAMNTRGMFSSPSFLPRLPRFSAPTRMSAALCWSVAGRSLPTRKLIATAAMSGLVPSFARTSPTLSPLLPLLRLLQPPTRYDSPSLLLRCIFAANSLLFSQRSVLELGSSGVADIDNQDANVAGFNGTALSIRHLSLSLAQRIPSLVLSLPPDTLIVAGGFSHAPNVAAS